MLSPNSTLLPNKRNNLKEGICTLCENVDWIDNSGTFSPLFRKQKNAFPKKSMNFPNSLNTGSCSMNSFVYAMPGRTQQWKGQPHIVTWSCGKKIQKEWGHILICPIIGGTAENNHLGYPILICIVLVWITQMLLEELDNWTPRAWHKPRYSTWALQAKIKYINDRRGFLNQVSCRKNWTLFF